MQFVVLKYKYHNKSRPFKNIWVLYAERYGIHDINTKYVLFCTINNF
jgi:hypothetical protein